jgi:hypothetical protein
MVLMNASDRSLQSALLPYTPYPDPLYLRLMPQTVRKNQGISVPRAMRPHVSAFVIDAHKSCMVLLKRVG